MADASPDEVLEELLCWPKIVVREEPNVAGEVVLIGPVCCSHVCVTQSHGSHCAAGNSMMGVLDTVMTAKEHPWPSEVAAAANINDRHAAVRAYMSVEAERLGNLCYAAQHYATYSLMCQARGNLMLSRDITNQVGSSCVWHHAKHRTACAWRQGAPCPSIWRCVMLSCIK